MKRIACIIVTYNRLQLLKECINSLKNQTYSSFDIIVVNNGSSDGTQEWLLGQKDIRTITQENLGGAGGFYTGMKTAYDDGYEWVWMMDDDGVAEKAQLENLLEGAENCQSKFLNALVCNICNPELLSFSLVLNGSVIKRVDEAKQQSFIFDSINPFNGTLIHRDVIERIGFVKKEMFIWGDEIEYTLRAKMAGFKQFTITSAIHFHPSIKSPQLRIIPFIKRYTVDVPSNKERAYIKYRNNGYICHTYYPNKEIIEKMKYAIYFITHLKFKEYISFLKWFNRGKKNLF